MRAVTTERAMERALPVPAANIVRAHPTSGRLFNAYNYGGYLTWILYPEHPV